MRVLIVEIDDGDDDDGDEQATHTHQVDPVSEIDGERDITLEVGETHTGTHTHKGGGPGRREDLKGNLGTFSEGTGRLAVLVESLSSVF